MEARYRDFIQDIVISVHANIREVNERKGFADPEELDYIEAKLLAYNEVLSMMRASAAEFKLPLSELGL
jgi:hypothetical protein